MKQALKLSLILTLFINVMYSQSKNDVARAYYVEAEKNYELNNYSKALSNIKKIEGILQDTNSRVLGLKIKILYAKGDYSSAKKYLDPFFKYESTEALKNEILGYLVKIDDKIDEENKRLARETERQKQLEIERAKKKAKEKEKENKIKYYLNLIRNTSGYTISDDGKLSWSYSWKTWKKGKRINKTSKGYLFLKNILNIRQSKRNKTSYYIDLKYDEYYDKTEVAGEKSPRFKKTNSKWFPVKLGFDTNEELEGFKFLVDYYKRK